MSHPSLEVADIFRRFGPQFRQQHSGHLSYQQYQVMNAVERCRHAELGGHTLTCQDCGHVHIAYNSCRNRHCPKCQGSAAKRWLQKRMQDVLPIEYYHVVFSLPAELADLAYYNKSVMYKLLFQAVSETLMTLAADPKRLGAKVGGTLVLHTWGSAMTHHPHIHGIITGGGLSADGERWIRCKNSYFLPVKVLSRLFRRLYLQKVTRAFKQQQLKFINRFKKLKAPNDFGLWLNQFRKVKWVVYAKPPFGGPESVLAYLSRYTHRVAIANSRLLSLKDQQVTFKYKDYREEDQTKIHKVMTLDVNNFMQRFLLHILPPGFHRIRHFGLLTNSNRKNNLAKARQLLAGATSSAIEEDNNPDMSQTEAIDSSFYCPVCGSLHILVIDIPRQPPKRAPPLMEKRGSKQ
jgi:predicted RNA-binding Zn-ribbon protein involved in translation (DUF1610 family)